MECECGFASEDGYEDQQWGQSWAFKSRDWRKNPLLGWQHAIEEYSKLQLTYKKARLPAIAALAGRMSRVRETIDVYVAGMWKDGVISDLWWHHRPERLKPRPERMTPSWSWASAQGPVYYVPPVDDFCSVELVSLESTIVGGP